MNDILIDPHVDSIMMPENLKIGLMVAEYREICGRMGCPCDYAGFAFGQSPFHIPPPLEKALAANTDKGHYVAAEGIIELREAISGFNKRYFGFDVDPARIMIGPGTKELIFTIFTMISGHVIIPSPSWIGYFPQLRLLGKKYHTLHLKPECGYKLQPRDLYALLSGLTEENRQHLLVLNNPHNPTGALYSREELEEIANVCRDNNTLVLADEIYALSTYNFEDFTSMGTVYPEGSFITNGLSKDRSAAGYRLGSCILPDLHSDIPAESFKKIAATIHTSVSTPTQYAGVTAYDPNEEIEEYFKITREIHRIMGSYMSREFNNIDGIRATVPLGTFYFLADFNMLAAKLKAKGVADSNELGRSLLAHPYHIATVTGDAIMVRSDNFSARIAFVDYDGKSAFEDYKAHSPLSEPEEERFVERNAPNMVRGVETLRRYIEDLNK